MPRKNNLPNVVVDEELAKSPEICTEIIQNVRNLAELNAKGRPSNVTELNERISEYFEYCAQYGCRPGIESLCLALACSRQSLFKWCRQENCDKQFAESCRTAKQMIITFLEQATLKNRINPTNYIFMMKNWANYADSITIIDEVEERPRTLSLSDLPKLDFTNKRNADDSLKSYTSSSDLPFPNMGEENKTPLPYQMEDEFI